MRRRRRGAALAVVVGLALSGCGTQFHPGQAAIVDGDAISASHVDDLVLAACDYSEQVRVEQGGAEPTQSMASLRFGLMQALIQFDITDEAARQLGLSVSDAKIAEVASTSTMPPGLSSSSESLLKQFFSDSAKAQLQQAVIGAHLRDPKVTTADSVNQSDVQAAAPYLKKFAAKQDVIVDPSFGRWNGTTLVSASGSLSDPVSTTPPAVGGPSPAVADLPPSQVCG